MVKIRRKAPLCGAFLLTENRNFDRNPIRGCNFGSEGVQFLI